jgi:hypothetical protein
VVSSDLVVGGHHAICSSKNGSKGMYSGRIELASEFDSLLIYILYLLEVWLFVIFCCDRDTLYGTGIDSWFC